MSATYPSLFRIAVAAALLAAPLSAPVAAQSPDAIPAKYREIAELMDTAIDTVKSQISQARQRLKEELGDLFDLPEP